MRICAFGALSIENEIIHVFYTRHFEIDVSLCSSAIFALATAAPVMAAPEIVVSGDRADAESIKSFFAGTSEAEIDKGLRRYALQGAIQRSPPAVRVIALLFG